MANQEESNGLVTINEEFVANEQVNNCAGAEQPSVAPAAPSAPALAASDLVASSEDDDVEVNEHPPSSAPVQSEPVKPNKGHGNHHHHSSKNQRPKQKRSHSHSDPNKRASSKPGMASQTQGQVAVNAKPSSNNTLPTHVSLVYKPGGKAFPYMESVSRVLSIPVVESGMDMISGVYSKVKSVNPVLQWSFGRAEGAVRSSYKRSVSLLMPFSGTLSVVDAFLCRGLDMVEYKMPIINLPPELMVAASRDYMSMQSMRVVAPVLRMTASNARLADTLAARALDSADHYIDKFLPGDAATENGDAGSAGLASKGGATLQRADKLSRKLQRRLTRRTLAEARALRKDTENTLHTLIYLAEILVKDPRAFLEQCRAVWNHLSENEPENQVPPETLEERLALLVREVARRVVHLANYTAANANSKTVSNVANHVLKSVREEGVKVLTFAHSQLERVHMRQALNEVNSYTHHLLERLAHLLAFIRSSSHSLGQPFSHAGTNNIAAVN